MAKPVGPAPADAYEEYRRAQDAAKMAEAIKAQAATPVDEGFKLTQPFSTGSVSQTTAKAVSPGSLDIGTNSPSVPQWDGVGDVPAFQLQKPAMIQGGVDADDMSASAGTMAGAGIEAAGQAVSIIAQLAGQKAAKDATLALNDANRSSSEKMARAALNQDASQFDASSKMNAYQQLMAAMNNASDQTMRQRALNRSNTQNMGNALTTAFLGA